MEFLRLTKDSPIWLFKAYDYIRIDAFCFGQNIKIETEFSHDESDDTIEAIVAVEDHKPVAGLRITYLDENTGRIGRVCVIREKQRSGVGKQLIAEAEKWISEKGAKKVFITSQDRAAGFYEKCGYVINPSIDPDSFDPFKKKLSPEEKAQKKAEVGFVCVTMEKSLVE